MIFITYDLYFIFHQAMDPLPQYPLTHCMVYMIYMIRCADICFFLNLISNWNWKPMKKGISLELDLVMVEVQIQTKEI